MFGVNTYGAPYFGQGPMGVAVLPPPRIPPEYTKVRQMRLAVSGAEHMRCSASQGQHAAVAVSRAVHVQVRP